MWGTLRDAFGGKFMLMVAVSQHILKGLVAGGGSAGWIGLPQQYVYRKLGASSTEMQLYIAAANTPWSLKPLFGLLSDMFPICGWNKNSYLFLVTVLVVPAYLLLVIAPPWSSAVLVTVAFLLMFLQVAIVDLLVEAKYAEAIRGNPQHGPLLVTFVWVGVFGFGMISTGVVGWAIQTWQDKLGYIYLGALFFVLWILAPTLLNWLGEIKGATDWARVKSHTRYFVFSGLLACISLGTGFLGMFQKSPVVLLVAVLISSAILLVSIRFVVNKTIANATTFFFLQNILGLRLDSTLFVFFTEFAGGPRFGPIFYVTVLGVVANACSLIGIAFYKRFFSTSKYRTIFIVNNLVLCLLSLPSILIYGRWNLQLGIPDTVFVIGTGVIQQVVSMLSWMPSIIMISQLCPPSLEACIYAIVAGMMNLGSNLAAILGTCLVSALGITDTNFQNLYIAALISTFLPLLSLLLVGCTIPDARQNQSLAPPAPADLELASVTRVPPDSEPPAIPPVQL